MGHGCFRVGKEGDERRERRRVNPSPGLNVVKPKKKKGPRN